MSGKQTYKVIDIFAGPGGLGEGFSSLGYAEGKSFFKLALSIEKNPTAHSTLLLRSFFRQFNSDNLPLEYWSYIKGNLTKAELFDLYPKQANAAALEARCLELGKTPYREVKNLIEQKLNGANKWVLVGGPPCQAYSTVGRARMRGTDPDFEKDERHLLYLEYLRVIADHRPPVFVMENVKGMLSAHHSGKKIIQNILRDLRKPDVAIRGRSSGLGYKLFSLVERKLPQKYEPDDFLVLAEQYGIPQARHRVLILGIRNDIDITPETLTKVNAVPVADAIGDLPRIRSCISREHDTLELWKQTLNSVTTKGWYHKGRCNGLLRTVEKIDATLDIVRDDNLFPGSEVLKYRGSPKIYSKWFRRACDGVVTSHSGRSHMKSDLHRYLFASSFSAVNRRPIHLSDFPAALLPNHQNVQDGVHNDHFGDRFRVQVDYKPSTTITSHISKDGHYFIHYDPSQCRSLTVREAARLQTFPDSYKFEGSRTSQYHQVGNAVPPLLAMQIAEIVHDVLKRIRI